MKQSTINKFESRLQDIVKSGKSIKKYCEENGLNENYFYSFMWKLRKDMELDLDAKAFLIKLYESVTKSESPIEIDDRFENLYEINVEEQPSQTVIPFEEDENLEETVHEEIVDEEGDTPVLTILRGQESDKIVGYKIQVKVRDSVNFNAQLSREEAEVIFGLYTYYGGNVTARNVANEFPRFTLQEVKKIIRAFKLTKDGQWFPPHLVEEMSESQLSEYRMNLKVRAATKYADANQERDYTKLIKDLVSENKKLSNQRAYIEELVKKYSQKEMITNQCPFERVEVNEETLILFLSDVHIGAKVESNSLYANQYDFEEVFNRANQIIEYILDLGYTFENIIITDLGDRIDGINQQTTRGGHILPQNMNNFEQVDTYVALIDYLFRELTSLKLANNYFYYAVNCGNHDGVVGYTAAKIAAGIVESKYNVETAVSNGFWLTFDIGSHTYLLSHGKDDKHMKGGLQINLNDKIENWINQYLDTIPTQPNINIVSGDLHNEAMNRGKRFKYFKVGSFFGSSDWCMYGFGNTTPHINYHIIKSNDIQLQGTIELQ